MPVARQVLAHAATAPDHVAVRAGDAPPLTYADLAARALGGAAALVRDGVLPGQVVAIDLSRGAADPPRTAPATTVPATPATSTTVPATTVRRSSLDGARHAIDTLVAMLAVDLAGAVALPCDDTWTPAQRTEILAATVPDHHLTTLPTSPPAPSGSVSGSAAEQTAEPIAEPVTEPSAEAVAEPVTAPVAEPVAVRDDDLAWAGFTSGSTGRPRAVVRTRGSWTASFAATSELTTITDADTVLIPGPLSTSLFCFGAVHALAVGATIRLAPSLPAAVPYLDTCDVVHLVPAALTAVLDALDALEAVGTRGSPAPRPSRLRVAVVGGAALPDATRDRAARHGLSVIAYYGATELSFVAIDPDGDGLRPFPGVEIEIRNPVAGLGEVWVRSPWIAHGYLAGADGPLRTADGWASVGDLAELTAGDADHPQSPPHLLLRGRGTGAITVGAATVVPEDVEAVLRTVPGVRDAMVVGTPHARLGQVVAAVVVPDREDEGGAPLDLAVLDLAVLERTCRDRLSPAQRPRRWFTADALPVTSTGKVARAVVQAELAEQNPAYRVVR